MDRSAVAEEFAEAADHSAGPCHAVTLGRELGEGGKPPRRVIETLDKTFGLVACTVGVSLPASATQPETQPSNQVAAFFTWSRVFERRHGS